MNESLDDTTVDRIVVCIQEAVGFGRKAFERFSLMTDVARDLGIDGDDANDLMIEFFRRFSIELNDYDPYRYFVGEGYDVFAFRRAKERRGHIPLRVGMLYLAVQEKRWDTCAFEKIGFSDRPLYKGTDDIPIDGYTINSR